MASPGRAGAGKLVAPSGKLGPPRGGRKLRSGPTAPPHDALEIPVVLAFADRLALVVTALAAREREFDLGTAALEVELQRDQRETALGDAAREPRNLVLVEQQLALPQRRRVGPSRLLVGANVGVQEGLNLSSHLIWNGEI